MAGPKFNFQPYDMTTNFPLYINGLPSLETYLIRQGTGIDAKITSRKQLYLWYIEVIAKLHKQFDAQNRILLAHIKL